MTPGHVQALQRDETVKFRPHGRSMEPLINSGNLVTVAPISQVQPKKGDAVFCKVKGRLMVHKVLRDDPYGRGWLIGNNKGGENGWTRTVYGVVVEVKS